MLNYLPPLRLRSLGNLGTPFLYSLYMPYLSCVCPKAKLQFPNLYSNHRLISLPLLWQCSLTEQLSHFDHQNPFYNTYAFDLLDIQVENVEERLQCQSPPFTLTHTADHHVSSCSALFISITILPSQSSAVFVARAP